jgi:hypothetical protein
MPLLTELGFVWAEFYKDIAPTVLDARAERDLQKRVASNRSPLPNVQLHQNILARRLTKN